MNKLTPAAQLSMTRPTGLIDADYKKLPMGSSVITGGFLPITFAM
jgi:hypothetical protein